jgi:hypothetical protein
LAYLGSAIFRELMLSQEEFGFTGDDIWIKLPCDSVVMENAVCFLRREASEEVERAVLSSMERPFHYECDHLTPFIRVSQHLAVPSF